MTHKTKGRFVLAVALLALTFCLLSTAQAVVPDWMVREGSIYHAMTLEDNSPVYLDAVIVGKIQTSAHPEYFTIREVYRIKDLDGALVVVTPPSPDLRIGQTVDIEGIITTLPNGHRAITDVTVWAYADKEGNILRHGPLIKGLLKRIPWEWMVDVTIRPKTLPEPISPRSNEPNTTPRPGPVFYQRINDALGRVRTLADGDFIDLAAFECKPILSTGVDQTYGNYFIMGEDSGPGTLKVYYQTAVSTTSRINKVSGQLREEGGGQVLCVNDGPGYDPQIFEGGLQTAAQGSIAWAKTYDDGTTLPAALEDKVVSRAYPSAGYFYIQEPMRESGIRVYDQSAAQVVQPGTTVTISGTISSQDGERMLTSSSVTVTGSADPPEPLGMNHRVIGGGNFNTYTPGITGCSEMHNVGLLARVVGWVTSVGTDYFYLDDGANVDNGTGNPRGLKVTWAWHGSFDGDPQIVAPDVGAYVCVTGVSSSEISQGRTNRALRLRKQDDLQIIIPGDEDTTPPTPGIASSPAYCASGSITVDYFGAYDSGSGLKKVELWYKKGIDGSWTNSTLTQTGASGSFPFNPTNGPGTYYFDLVAEDNADNRSADAADEGDCSTIYTSGLDACSFSTILIP